MKALFFVFLPFSVQASPLGMAIEAQCRQPEAIVHLEVGSGDVHSLSVKEEKGSEQRCLLKFTDADSTERLLARKNTLYFKLSDCKGKTKKWHPKSSGFITVTHSKRVTHGYVNAVRNLEAIPCYFPTFDAQKVEALSKKHQKMMGQKL